MAAYRVIKLKNLTPLHVGTGKENYDFSAGILHSDTLSSALAAIRAQNGNTDNLYDFLDSFRISSAFPFWKNRYFLPRINGEMKHLNVVEGERRLAVEEYRKKLKRVEYVEYPLWKRMLAGEEVTVDCKGQLSGGYLLEAPLETSQIYQSQVMQRVSVPRNDGQDAEPFFFDWMYWHKEGGLYCLTDATGTVLDELVTLFEQLGEQGIGTDKNVGGGKFEVEVDELEIDTPKGVNATLLLSLYLPAEEEMKLLGLDSARYTMLLRGGFLAGSTEENFRHLRKRSVYMFGVGSVFHTIKTLEGKIVDLKPDWNDARMHPVYRSGRPLCVSIKIESDE